MGKTLLYTVLFKGEIYHVRIIHCRTGFRPSSAESGTMKATPSPGGLTIFRPADIRPVMRIPLFVERCAAGFPSPAADYVESVRHEVA
jgi:hypothetical protein